MFRAWCLAEVLFYGYFRWHLRRLQRRTPPSRFPPGLRRDAFQRILDFFRDPASAKQFLSGWFCGAPFQSIYHDNAKEWLSCAMFFCAPEALTSGEHEEVDTIIQRFETRFLDRPFPKGRNDQLTCARLTLDPVRAVHRPLAFYAGVKCMSWILGLILRAQGFQRYQSGRMWYWYRRWPDAGHPPLVFVHGIGIGILPYYWFLSRLWVTRPMFILEVPYVSMQLTSVNMTVDETVDAVDDMMRTHQVQHACIMGHSFGSIIAAWIIKSLPHRVSSIVLLDPVCFLLFLPDVCCNFVYATPRSRLRDWLVHYFAKRELHVSHTLSRHFWWHRNILWAEELPPTVPTTVLLSGRDEIAPAASVREYLQQFPHVHVLWYEELRHAQFLLRRDIQQRIVERVL